MKWLYSHHSDNNYIKIHYQLTETDVLPNKSGLLLGPYVKYNQMQDHC